MPTYNESRQRILELIKQISASKVQTGQAWGQGFAALGEGIGGGIAAKKKRLWEAGQAETAFGREQAGREKITGMTDTAAMARIQAQLETGKTEAGLGREFTAGESALERANRLKIEGLRIQTEAEQEDKNFRPMVYLDQTHDEVFGPTRGKFDPATGLRKPLTPDEVKRFRAYVMADITGMTDKKHKMVMNALEIWLDEYSQEISLTPTPSFPTSPAYGRIDTLLQDVKRLNLSEEDRNTVEAIEKIDQMWRAGDILEKPSTKETMDILDAIWQKYGNIMCPSKKIPGRF